MQQTWVAPIAPVNTSDGTALASSTTLTDISPVPQITIPANFLVPGSRLEVEASGKFSNTGTPTLLLGVYWGGVAGTKLAATGATTTTTAATNWPWRIKANIDVRAIGTSGSFVTTGFVWLATSLTAFSTIPIDAAAVAAVSVDTTTAKTLTIGAQWGTSNASNTTTCVSVMVKSVV